MWSNLGKNVTVSVTNPIVPSSSHGPVWHFKVDENTFSQQQLSFESQHFRKNIQYMSLPCDKKSFSEGSPLLQLFESIVFTAQSQDLLMPILLQKFASNSWAFFLRLFVTGTWYCENLPNSLRLRKMLKTNYKLFLLLRVKRKIKQDTENLIMKKRVQ
jgi:hypothetical protein